eukprot:1062761-Amphidinium_carterae.2
MVFGFANPDHRLPPVPVQPGSRGIGSANLQVWRLNCRRLLLGRLSQASAIVNNGQAIPKSVEAMRTSSRCPLYAQVEDGRATVAHTHPNRPAKPDVQNTPNFDKRNIVQADVRGFQASGKHSTKRLLGQSPHPGYGTGRSPPSSAVPIQVMALVHSKGLDYIVPGRNSCQALPRVIVRAVQPRLVREVFPRAPGRPEEPPGLAAVLQAHVASVQVGQLAHSNICKEVPDHAGAMVARASSRLGHPSMT